MTIALDIPRNRRTIGALRLCLMMALTLLTIGFSFSHWPAGESAQAGAGESRLTVAPSR
jgi:hypothetical protein